MAKRVGLLLFFLFHTTWGGVVVTKRDVSTTGTGDGTASAELAGGIEVSGGPAQFSLGGYVSSGLNVDQNLQSSYGNAWSSSDGWGTAQGQSITGGFEGSAQSQGAVNFVYTSNGGTTAAPETTTGWTAPTESTTGWTAPPETTTGWTAPPETTTGWTAPPDTTTAAPETTTGWTAPPETTTAAPETTTGWTAPPETTTAAPETTTGWTAPPETTTTAAPETTTTEAPETTTTDGWRVRDGDLDMSGQGNANAAADGGIHGYASADDKPATLNLSFNAYASDNANAWVDNPEMSAGSYASASFSADGTGNDVHAHGHLSDSIDPAHAQGSIQQGS